MEGQNKGEDDLVGYVHKYEAQIVITSIVFVLHLSTVNLRLHAWKKYFQSMFVISLHM
jgi:hypothetical protein